MRYAAALGFGLALAAIGGAFVDPGVRGRGVGKGLLRHLARRCVAERLGRLEWAVLDWNALAIDFYRSQGALMLDDWERCRVAGEALVRLASVD